MQVLPPPAQLSRRQLLRWAPLGARPDGLLRQAELKPQLLYSSGRSSGL